MKVLDTEVAKIDGAAIVAVWLGDKAFDKHKDYLPRINMSLKFEKTSLSAFDGEKGGPNNWGINPDAHLTVVVANKGKVVKSFPFTTVNETDVRPAQARIRDGGARDVERLEAGLGGERRGERVVDAGRDQDRLLAQPCGKGCHAASISMSLASLLIGLGIISSG